MTRFLLILFFTPLSIVGISAQNSLQRSVYFDKDKSELKAQGETSLSEVMDFLSKNPTFQILLKGFTDADGSDEHNRVLSEKRVLTVRQFLERKGVNAAKITTLALGETEPIADNTKEDGKKQNRRVDINVTSMPPSVSTTQTPKYKSDNILNLYRELATTIQIFKINTSKDTVLKGAKGTVLVIPQNAFVGVPNGAIIDFKLKEAYSFSDIIRDNLNTMSGNQAMQTGGMIYVEANYNGQKLSLKQDLQVQFNSKESQLKGMQLFMGERTSLQNGAINWKPLNEPQEIVGSPADPTTIFTRGLEGDAFVPYLVLNEKSRKPLTIKEVCDTTGCSPLLLKANVKDSFTVRGDMSNTCGTMARYVATHPAMRDKPLSKIHRATFDDAYILYNTNEFDVLKKQNNGKWDSLMKERMNIVFFTESPAYIARKKSEDSMRLFYLERARIQDSLLTIKIGKNPAFALNKLGWVNCDRLNRLDDKQIATIKINFIVKENCDIKVISKQGKQVLAPSDNKNDVLDFSVKKGEDLVLIAMKIENGEPFLAITDIKGQNTTLTPNFKALSPAQIKEKLKMLDN